MKSNRRLALRMLSKQLNLNSYTVHGILTEHLQKRKVYTKMVPKNLKIEQKDIHKSKRLDPPDKIAKGQDFFSLLITEDES